ncbi:tripartite tricarboxylate transporter TctB family protein [Brevibacillus marinus]|uniref:tripartite tricarboxylate transporter TctB family protein n=1 Tax=Brevibacillus marinus TaxID=2496837 RepID=UPI000F82502D|nr:tripartite tricarboxylate transporter TctB family protein [Brevibacillus marinus]
MGEIIFHIILMVALVLFYKESFAIETGRAADPIGPAGFPKAIIIFAFVLLVISLFQAIRKWMKRDKNAPASKPAELSLVFFGILGSIAVYVLIVEFLGFIITTILFLLFLFWLLGRKVNIKQVGLAVVFSLGFTLVFGTILNLQLPRGIEALRILSYWIY